MTISPTKDQWTPTQVLQGHLGSIIDSKGSVSLRLPERCCEMIRRDTRHLLSPNITKPSSHQILGFATFQVTGQEVNTLSDIPLTLFHLLSIYNSQERFRPRSFLTQHTVHDLAYWYHMSTSHPDNLSTLCPNLLLQS